MPDLLLLVPGKTKFLTVSISSSVFLSVGVLGIYFFLSSCILSTMAISSGDRASDSPSARGIGAAAWSSIDSKNGLDSSLSSK